MNQTSTKSGLFRKLSIGLGLALAVSTIGVSASSAKSAPQAKRSGKDIIILIGEKDAGWCSQDSPGGGQIGASGSVLEGLTIMNNKGDIVPYLAESLTASNVSSRLRHQQNSSALRGQNNKINVSIRT